ncbi:transposase [Pseudacidovorax sp. 1753]|uniref:transposase n=1 Tax=Pseudacidovorax sp. 1753 TaxID=3156419 RepID=UPI0033943941
MDTPIALRDGRRRRRLHSAEFKAHIVAACCQPGVSSASAAMANGINASPVRRWVKDA